MDFKIKRKSSLYSKKLSRPNSTTFKKPINQTQEDDDIQNIINRIQKESDMIETPILTKDEQIMQVQNDQQYKDNLLMKAKLLVNKAKKEGTLEKAKTRQAKAKIKQAQNDPFLTGFKIEQDEEIKIKETPTETVDYVNDNDVISNIKEDLENEDQLEKLRRMIKKTKANITDYVGDLYELNGKVQEANGYFKQMGQNHDEDVFQQFNTTFNQYLPGGNKNLLFKKK